MSRPGSYILSNRIVVTWLFFVATRVLILCHNDVAIEVFLSRLRQPIQEARCQDRVWPWARNFMTQ